jgi:Na+/proline symporter
LLAPSVSFSENILKPFFKDMGDHQFLKLMRIVLVGFTCMVTFFALNSEASIYKMVENAYKVTLVGAFVPLVCGLYWKRATNLGGMLSVTAGLVVWITCEIYYKDAAAPPLVPQQLAGLIASFAGMIVGSLAWRSQQRAATT